MMPTNTNHNNHVWDNIDLVDKEATKLGIDPAVVSELGLGVLLRASESFNENRAKFRTYARVLLRREFGKYAIREGLVRELAEENFRQQSGSSLYCLLRDNESETAEQIIERLRSLLSEFEYQLLVDRYVHGKTLRDIGVEHGVPRGTVWAWEQKILRKVQGENKC